MASPELFENVFHAWLEANGVALGDVVSCKPGDTRFAASIDLNTLKLGFIELLAFEQVRTTHDLLHDPELVPAGQCQFCDEERGGDGIAEQPEEA